MIAIGRFQSLEKLILGKWDGKAEKRKGNLLTAISQEVFQLTNLKELHIQYNQITAIPDAIARLNSICQGTIWENCDRLSKKLVKCH